MYKQNAKTTKWTNTHYNAHNFTWKTLNEEKKTTGTEIHYIKEYTEIKQITTLFTQSVSASQGSWRHSYGPCVCVCVCMCASHTVYNAS